MMAAAACTSVLANAAGADVAHEVQGRFHDTAMVKARQNTNNLQTFTGALGGIRADAVSDKLLTSCMLRGRWSPPYTPWVPGRTKKMGTVKVVIMILGYCPIYIWEKEETLSANAIPYSS